MLSTSMESPDSGPMDPPSGGRLPNRFLINSPNRNFVPSLQHGSDSSGSPRSRDFGSLQQGGNRKGQIRKTGVRQPNVCGSQKGRQVETNHQSKVPQPICDKPPLQDGRHQKSEGHPPGRGSACQIGPEGCVFLRTDCGEQSEISAVLLEESTTPIHVPTLWPEQRTLCFHETTSSDSYLCERQRSLVSDVLG